MSEDKKLKEQLKSMMVEVINDAWDVAGAELRKELICDIFANKIYVRDEAGERTFEFDDLIEDYIGSNIEKDDVEMCLYLAETLEDQVKLLREHAFKLNPDYKEDE